MSFNDEPYDPPLSPRYTEWASDAAEFDAWVAAVTGFTKSRVRKLLRVKGAVTLDGRPVSHPGQLLEKNQTIVIKDMGSTTTLVYPTGLKAPGGLSRGVVTSGFDSKKKTAMKEVGPPSSISTLLKSEIDMAQVVLQPLPGEKLEDIHSHPVPGNPSLHTVILDNFVTPQTPADVVGEKLRRLGGMGDVDVARVLPPPSEDSEICMEYVLGDYRLEFVELLALEGIVEVIFLRGSDDIEDQIWLAPLATSPEITSLDWQRDSIGFMYVPRHSAIEIPRGLKNMFTRQMDLLRDTCVQVSNSWYIYLRSLFDVPNDYALLVNQCERMFIIPVPADNQSRVVHVTNSACFYEKRDLISADTFFAHALLFPCGGEWPNTKADVLAYESADHVPDPTPAPTPALRKEESSVSSPANLPPEAAHRLLTPQDQTPTPKGGLRSSFPAVVASSSSSSLSAAGAPATVAVAVAPRSATSSSAVSVQYPVMVASGSGSAPMSSTTSSSGLSSLSSSSAPGGSSGSKKAVMKPSLVVPPPGGSVEGSSKASGLDLSFAVGLYLFPHQERTLDWMLARERSSPESNVLRVVEMKIFRNHFAYTTGLSPSPVGDYLSVLCGRLPRGGIVGHPVGAGKTVITIALIGKTLGAGQTLVLVPDHIAIQWERELKRFLPTVRVVVVQDDPSVLNRKDMDVFVIPYSQLNNKALLFEVAYHGIGYPRTWHRACFDEPQDVANEAFFEDLVCQVKAEHRWVLTATPSPLELILELMWGERMSHTTAKALRSQMVQRCCRRERAADCLPVPALHMHMVPVTLTWQETSVVQLYAMNQQLQATIRLCSYFANVDRFGNLIGEGEEEAVRKEAPQEFSSLDAWVSHHRTLQEETLADVLPRLDAVKRAIDEARAAAQAERALIQEVPVAAADPAETAKALERAAHYEAVAAEYLRQKKAKEDAARIARGEIIEEPDFVVVQMEASADEWLGGEWMKRTGPLYKGKKKNRAGASSQTDAKGDREEREEEDDGGEGEEEQAEEEEEGTAEMTGDKSGSGDGGDMRLRAMSSDVAREVLERLKDKAESSMTKVELICKRKAEAVLTRLEAGPAAGPSLSTNQKLNEVFVDLGVDPELLMERDSLEALATRLRSTLQFFTSVTETLTRADSECAICLSNLRDQLVTMLPCFHAFRSSCVVRMFGLSNTAVCPLCRAQVSKRLLCTFQNTMVSNSVNSSEETSAAAALEAPPPSQKSVKEMFGSKLEALEAAIRTVLTVSQDEKILVFGQWDELLQQTEAALQYCGIPCLRLSNDMMKRSQILDKFQRDASARVLLLSSQHHASGANLNVANHVFILHPFCPSNIASANYVPLEQAQAFERQAIGRVHRYPQRKDVHVYRMYARGTVEEDLYAAWGWT